MMMKDKSWQILIHVAGCIVFLSLPVILWPGQGNLADFFNEPRSAREFTNDVLILLFFYLNFYLLIPKLYFPKKYVYFILAVTMCFFVATRLSRDRLSDGSTTRLPSCLLQLNMRMAIIKSIEKSVFI